MYCGLDNQKRVTCRVEYTLDSISDLRDDLQLVYTFSGSNYMQSFYDLCMIKKVLHVLLYQFV